ncbi:MAG: STAS domain-containing protein [Pseudomonadota bacterium]
MSNPKGEGGGLFSKVVKFVRNPSTTWSDPDAPSDAPESGYSRQMLKEMIERKRRNDFVRKREFDMLRKLQRNEALAGHDPSARPSFFQSSMPSRPDDRASTLKKIDEIEAQMSQQWWKTRAPESSSRPGSVPGGPASGPGGLPGGSAASGRKSAPDADLPTRDAGPTDLGFSFSLPPEVQAPAPPPPLMPATVSATVAAPRATGFYPSAAVPLDLPPFTHDPELEDAAIRFASGDDDGAEAALWELLGPGGPRQDDEATWLALFDFYRASGRRERFDEAAVDFAGRFSRSAPQWVSLPELASRTVSASAGAPQAAHSAHWASAGSLGPQSVATLVATLARIPQPWRLSWARLTTIEEGALEPLTRLFTQWAAQAVQVHFIDADRLDKALRQRTVSGDRDADPGWWRLRMEALRVMHRPDEFEIVALDYCVTYEVSPPSWETPRGRFKALQADGSSAEGSVSLHSEPFRDSGLSGGPASGFGDGAAGQAGSAVARAELVGTLQGDTAQALDRLDERLAGADVSEIEIDCARLVRMDFGASGSLLNWVAARAGEGRQLHFTSVHRLIATFLGVVGITGSARISLRRD